MESKLGDKSRKEKRKEARLAKQQHRHLSRIEHQKSNKLKKDLKRETSKKLKTKVNEISDRSENQNLVVCSERDGSKNKPSLPSKSEVKVDSLKNSTALKMTKEKKGLKTKSKTKFEEYLQMDMKIGGISAKEDLELERKLAKKLKIKGGKLRGMDDGMDMLFEGIPSAIDTLTDKEFQDAEEVVKDSKHKSTKKSKRKKLTNASMQGVEDGTEAGMEMGGMDDCMDMLFEGIPSAIDTLTDKELQDAEEVVKDSKHKSTKKRKRKKLTNASMQGVEDGTEADMAMGGSEPGMNSIVEVNKEDSSERKPPAVTANVKYVAPHLRSRAGNEPEEYTQIRRQVRGLLNRLSESNVEPITQEISTILRSVSRSAGSQIISEEVLASCVGGPRGNEQYAAVFAAFVAGLACLVGIAFSAKLISSLAKSFEDEYLKEDNLSMRNLILLLSYLCIFGVCSSDLIYDFLIILSKRLMEIDVSTILTILQCCGMKLRGDDPAAMKDFIVSIQNRVAELKSPSGSTSGDQPMINNRRMEFMLETICDIKNNKKKSKEDPTQHTRIKKWLQKLRTEDILLRGLKWNQLLDPNKKGQWWLSGDVASTTDKVEELANTIDKEVLEAQKMLQLAAAQRMNTDSRRAIFCIIMSGEDYIDAFEKLLRLDLPGKQDREIMRVLVDCCLQEKVFNKYYTVLAAKLCNYDKNHKFTLQYCLWDHFKALESMELIRSKNLARFIAEMLITFSLSLAVLKTVDLSDPMQLTPKRIMHFRMLFDAIFEQPDSVVWNVFTRVAVAPELEDMRTGLEFFIKQYVLSSNKAFSVKFKVAKKALSNIAGILM